MTSFDDWPEKLQPGASNPDDEPLRRDAADRIAADAYQGPAPTTTKVDEPSPFRRRRDRT